jgi:hypothetical protein
MKFNRASLIYLGLVGAFAVGLAVGPLVGANHGEARAAVEVPKTRPALTPTATPAADGTLARRLERVPTASAEPVQRQAKQLLNRGTDVRKASEGFPNAYQFMTVAYAAKNTDIPFVVLKHRVLSEGKPLGTAIGELKPELDEVAEVNRARAEARADLARIRG